MLFWWATEFGGRARWGYNAVNDGVNEDCEGHGTHVAGIAVGINVGVAKTASVVAVKVLNCTGQGSSFGTVQGIVWAINDCTGNCIFSLSLGGVRLHSFDYSDDDIDARARSHTLLFRAVCTRAGSATG